MFRSVSHAQPTNAKKSVDANDQAALILDVRTAEEFADAHIDGALNIPVQELQQRYVELGQDKQQSIIIYCRSGARSAMAARMLSQLGFTRVKDIGAMSNWRA
jgi:rhodanese-related sulfurtransferase